MNPFELRYAIFAKAKELVEDQYKAHMAAWELMDKTTQEAKELCPKFPSLREVLDAALEINKFISETNEKAITHQARKMIGM